MTADRLRGRVALVTGGTGRIGRAVAASMLADGAAAVVVTGRSEKQGAACLPDLGARAYFIPQDVTDEKRWSAVVAEVVERFGALDILVNNAGWMGGNVPQSPADTTLEHWQRVMAVNLDGTFLGCQSAIAVMRGRGGAIVNVSSTAGLLSTPAFVAYGAAKAAVTHLTKSVAVYCARNGSGIRCNCVHPALVDTPLGTEVLSRFDADRERALAGYLARVPLGTLAMPDDVAAAVTYLASDDARYITGEGLVIGGGIGI